jgi:hypothetical protein
MPDRKTFQDFDEALRLAMRTETELLFETIMAEDRSVLDFLEADYTFVNARLGRHYGLTNVIGDAFQRVSLTGTPRRGLLAQASILTVTSNPTRTSPVKRGKWVLENLLNAPPPPPPPDCPNLSRKRSLKEHCAKEWNSTGTIQLALPVTPAWTRLALVWRISMALVPGAIRIAAGRSIRADNWPRERHSADQPS